MAYNIQPAAGRIDRELRGVVVDTNACATNIGCNVVDAMRDCLAKLLVNEIMHINIVRAVILVWTDRVLRLCVDRDYRLTVRLRDDYLNVDVLELAATVKIAAAFLGLVGSVLHQVKHFQDAALLDLMSHSAECRRQFLVALRYPQQWAHWIAHRRWFQYLAKVFQQRGV